MQPSSGWCTALWEVNDRRGQVFPSTITFMPLNTACFSTFGNSQGSSANVSTVPLPKSSALSSVIGLPVQASLSIAIFLPFEQIVTFRGARQKIPTPAGSSASSNAGSQSESPRSRSLEKSLIPHPLSWTVTRPSLLVMVTSVAPARREFCRISMTLPSSVPVNNLLAFVSNLSLTFARITVSIRMPPFPEKAMARFTWGACHLVTRHVSSELL